MLRHFDQEVLPQRCRLRFYFDKAKKGNFVKGKNASIGHSRLISRLIYCKCERLLLLITKKKYTLNVAKVDAEEDDVLEDCKSKFCCTLASAALALTACLGA